MKQDLYYLSEIYKDNINTYNKSLKDDSFNTWDYEVRVVGEGINTKTGENISFFTTQTGL